MHRPPRLKLAALLAGLALVGVAAAATPTPSSAQVVAPDVDADLDVTQASVRQAQADVAVELDVLHATNAQVGEALTALDQNVAGQQAQTDLATQAADAARAEEAAAAQRVLGAQAQVDALAARLRGMAVNLYVRPPVEDAVHAVITATPSEAPVSFALARFRVESATDVLHAAEQAHEELTAAQAAAIAARQQAEAAAAAEQAKLASLQTARVQQQDFALQVSDRIEHALGEAVQLASYDAELSAQIQQRELELAARVSASLAQAGGTVMVVSAPADAPATPADTAPTTAPPASPVSAASETTTATTGPPAPPPPTAPPTTEAPAPTTTTAPVRVITITPVATTWVHGIEVASIIAPQFRALMEAAAADGFNLTGSGYRNIVDQIEIRREVCGTTDYDIFLKPSWECSPPVARPGTSMHEKGLAVDFSDGPDLIRTQDHPAFVWLAAHAAAFGFFNLPSEPWHWSVNGR